MTEAEWLNATKPFTSQQIARDFGTTRKLRLLMVGLLDKVGFKNPNRVEYVSVNLDALQKLAEDHSVSAIDFETLKAHGLVSRNDLVKILGRGELKAKVEVKAHAFSATAQKAIEAAGGTIEKL